MINAKLDRASAAGGECRELADPIENRPNVQVGVAGQPKRLTRGSRHVGTHAVLVPDGLCGAAGAVNWPTKDSFPRGTRAPGACIVALQRTILMSAYLFFWTFYGRFCHFENSMFSAFSAILWQKIQNDRK